jgi:transcriptional regulator with XRE-family HTH domain
MTSTGLRRQEVAELAGISIDCYIRLEQGRGPHPSRQVLAALARALMPPPTVGPSRELTPGLRHLIDALTETPAGRGPQHDALDVPPAHHPPALERPGHGPVRAQHECQVLHVPDTDQRLIVYSPEPGSPT